MINESALMKELENWVESPDMFIRIMKKHMFFPGEYAYVVTQEYKHKPFQVIKVLITVVRYSKRTETTHITCEGEYDSGYYYNASFKQSSFNKNIFLDKSLAEEACKSANKKKGFNV